MPPAKKSATPTKSAVQATITHKHLAAAWQPPPTANNAATIGITPII